MRALAARLVQLQAWLETLGGARPTRRRGWLPAVALGVWWTVLFVVVFATIGRASKFIYVDF